MSSVLEEAAEARANSKYKNHKSDWVRGFTCDHMKILIVCRGPIRKEAMDVIAELGAEYGILLSEKDSVTYANTLAPELRMIQDQDNVHRVPDYSGATSQERKERIAQFISVCHKYKYTHIFAGYGFMAEDADFVESIETAGIGFIGPASGVHRQAGAKDEAKKLARRLNVSVTPGLDNITARTLLQKAGGSREGLKKIADTNSLTPGAEPEDLEEYAEAIIQAGYTKGIGLITTEEIQVEAKKEVAKILQENPGKRLRFKYIGGGGGKGQRIVTSVDESDNAVIEVLQESKAMGDADNKNFLIEMNIENTRHNEIQLLGNGEWCIALGGRDCSLQMHEQKLVEISITDELFDHEIKKAEANGQNSFAETLKKDRKLLDAMENQAEDFGRGVKLNSASTFECIVSDDGFYFMEMNTRIQVEHRVTEMAYSLRFANPDNQDDFFVVKSLVEAMILVAAYGAKLPQPIRHNRNIAGGEIRLNATNDALQPHAGGVIEYWSDPIKEEIRDDQGIGIRNPDTGSFIKYHLAGAYDSNVALLVTYGSNRLENLQRLNNILRQTELRGIDLKTNKEFHLGILNFIIGMHPMLKPDTNFVVPYLVAVGSLSREMESFEQTVAWTESLKLTKSKLNAEAADAMGNKATLINRPIKKLLANPHALMGWLILNRNRAYSLDGDKVNWKRNPLRVLNDMYEYLHLEDREGASPPQQIWKQDQKLLNVGLKFYADLEAKLGIDSEKDYLNSLENSKENSSVAYEELNATLQNDGKLAGLDDAFSAKCASAHRGWQIGLTLLNMLVLLGKRSGVLDFTIDENLKPVVPELFLKEENHKDFLRALEPPPAASGDELVSVSGGMFYPKETPDSPRYLEVGTHFNVGDPLYIIEVMKMFNKVHAEFAGTVEEVLLEGDLGVVVKKGQTLYKVKPDEVIHIESDDEKLARRKKYTLELMALV